LTKPRSPTTTGKIERWHRTLRRELLDHSGPFADISAAQAAIDAWVHGYNHSRPHQALDMATPPSLFRPARAQGTDRATMTTRQPTRGEQASRVASKPEAAAPTVIVPVSANAVEFDTVIAHSGLLSVLPRVQRVRMRREQHGRLAHVWADEHSVHICLDGQLVKTVASNLSASDLHELRMRGATPAGAPPATASTRNSELPAGAVVEIDRTVDPSGNVKLGTAKLSLGALLAGQRVTLRFDGHLVHVVHHGVLAKTLPSPINANQRGKLRGARLATNAPPPPPAGPVTVERRIPPDGVVMVTRQQIRVGRAHAAKTVTILVEDTCLRVLHNGEELSLHARTTSQPVTRFRAYAPRKPTS
jgi:integrase-like protein